jgi:EAL domain-containing protein (putative c-di-GMP-specific phosphodiesterase class I)
LTGIGGGIDMSVSVNVSATELEDDNFIDTVKCALAESGLAATV